MSSWILFVYWAHCSCDSVIACLGCVGSRLFPGRLACVAGAYYSLPLMGSISPSPSAGGSALFTHVDNLLSSTGLRSSLALTIPPNHPTTLPNHPIHDQSHHRTYALIKSAYYRNITRTAYLNGLDVSNVTIISSASINGCKLTQDCLILKT